MRFLSGYLSLLRVEKQKWASLRTMAGLAVVAFLAQMAYATLNFSALPIWVKFQMRQGAHLGWILATFMLTEAVLRPAMGSLSDRIGRKPLMLIGPAMGIFTSIATVYAGLHGHAVGLAMMFLLRAIDGVGLAAFWPAAFAVVGDAVHEKSRATAMAVLNGSGLAGIALGFLFGGLANDLTKSISGGFYFVSVVFLATFIAGLVIFPREPHKNIAHTSDEDKGHIPHTDEVKSAIGLVPDMLILSIVVFAAIGLLMPIVKLYAVEQLSMSETMFGLLSAPIVAVLGLLSVPLGRLGDKWGKVAAFCYGLAICSAAMWLVATVRSIIVLACASTMIGIGFALAFPAWMAMVSEAAPSDRRGQIMGAVGMAQGIGAIIGVTVGPMVYSSDWMSIPRLGVIHYNLPFYLCAMLLTLSTVMAFQWVSVIRKGLSGGAAISERERRAVRVLAIVGLVILTGWVVLRHTRPVAADRVAWLWVQAEVNGNPEKARKYTLPSFEESESGDKTVSEIVSRIYEKRVEVDKAHYTLLKPRYKDRGARAEVRVIFKYPNHTVTEEILTLQKQSDGDWKIVDTRSRR